ncbi:hypothetical protein OROMI_021133 [Orobanche minor]
MAESSKAVEVHQSDNFSEDVSAPSVLSIKNNNQYYDVNLEELHTSLRPAALYLMNSDIKQAITVRADVPLSILTLAYSTSFYDSANDVVKFMVPGVTVHKSLTRSRFCKLLGLPRWVHENEALANPEKIDSGNILGMLLEMGYKDDIQRISDFNKTKLGPQWHYLMTVLLKCFAERATGTEGASKMMIGMLYCLYYNSTYDISIGIWKQFIMGINHKNKSKEISFARFWSIIVKALLDATPDIKVTAKDAVAVLPELKISKLKMLISEDFKYGPPLSDWMEEDLPKDHSLIKKYFAQFRKSVKTKKRKETEDVQIEDSPRKTSKKSEGIVIREPSSSPKGFLKRTKTIAVKKSPKVKKSAKRDKAKKKKKVTFEDDDELVDTTVEEDYAEETTETENVGDKDEETDEENQGSEHSEERDVGGDGGMNVNDSENEEEPEKELEKEKGDGDASGGMEGRIPVVSEVENPVVSQPIVGEYYKSAEIVDLEEEADDVQMVDDSGDTLKINDIEIAPLVLEGEPLTEEADSLFASQKYIFNLNVKMNALLMATDVTQQKKLISEIKLHHDNVSGIRDRTREMLTAVDNSESELVKDLTEENEKLKAANQELLIKNDVLEARLNDCENRLVQQAKELKEKESDLLKAHVRNEHLSVELINLSENQKQALFEVNANIDRKLMAVNGALRKLASASVPILQKGGEGGAKTQEMIIPRPPISQQILRTIAATTLARTIQGVKIGEGSSSSSSKQIIISEATTTTSDKGKGIAIDDSELARQMELEFKQRALKRREAPLIRDTLTFLLPKPTLEEIQKASTKKFHSGMILPVFNFEINTSYNNQLDLPVLKKVFLFRAFNILNPLSSFAKAYNRSVTEFYDEYAQVPGFVWSCMPILKIVKIEKLLKFKDLFFNFKITVLRGEKKEVSVFTLADLPYMNPLDWITCWRLCSDVKEGSEILDVMTVRDHLTKMTRCYLLLLATVDCEIAKATLNSNAPVN